MVSSEWLVVCLTLSYFDLGLCLAGDEELTVMISLRFGRRLVDDFGLLLSMNQLYLVVYSEWSLIRSTLPLTPSAGSLSSSVALLDSIDFLVAFLPAITKF